MKTAQDGSEFADLSAEIVAAYVSQNALSPSDLPKLIAVVHASLKTLVLGAGVEQEEERKPSVPIRKSVTPDFLICLEDGKKFKALKRHLATAYNMTPQQYREKWGLPASYPMVAPTYSIARSALAKDIGLGRKLRRPVRKARKSVTTA